jgi:hypothetical protein
VKEYVMTFNPDNLPLDHTGQPTAVYKWDHRRYSSEERALMRVDALREFGIWPGVVRYRNGEFGLTYDPIGTGVTLKRSGS